MLTAVYCFPSGVVWEFQGRLRGDFQAEGWAGSDTWRLLRMQEGPVCESPQRRAQAETNTSYCSRAPQFAACSVPYILLLTESDISIRMMEGLGFFAEPRPVLNYNAWERGAEHCV